MPNPQSPTNQVSRFQRLASTASWSFRSRASSSYRVLLLLRSARQELEDRASAAAVDRAVAAAVADWDLDLGCFDEPEEAEAVDRLLLLIRSKVLLLLLRWQRERRVVAAGRRCVGVAAAAEE